MKKILIILLIIALLTTANSLTFTFQDNTLVSSLRVCTNSTCKNLKDSGNTTLNITSGYEIRNERVNPNTYDWLSNNYLGIIAVILVIITFLIVRNRYKNG